MNAEEARNLADQATARRELSAYLREVERRAKEGSYSHTVGGLTDRETRGFKLLGYVLKQGPGSNTTISWANHSA